MANEYYEKWYQDNKASLSERRKKKYAEDKEYRQKAVQAARDYRASKGAPKPDSYSLTFGDMAEALGVTLWTLRQWKEKNYYPSPLSHGGRLWFTEGQAGLLFKIAEFFKMHGPRVSGSAKSSLEDVTNLVYANWAI